jgi:ubiquinone/menaquinone biosynthesis C-methylase UbiE
MKLKKLQMTWDNFGKIDPLFAILTKWNKIGNRWDKKEFFETGKKEIFNVMKYVESLEVQLPRKKSLDFGCGVGRLTQALCQYFDKVYGIDIAPSMIDLARKYNRYRAKCEYFLNETDDLKIFPDNSFSFIYTKLTLQHIEPKHSKKYIKEFLRILAPNGLLIFQLPSHHIPLYKMFQRLFEFTFKIEMYGIRKYDVVKLLKRNNVKILDISKDFNAGFMWVSFQYCVTK